MLNQMRQAAQGGVSKVLMLILLISFAIWGVGSYEGFRTGTVATVGDASVTVQEFGRAYDEATRAAQQTGQQPNADQVLSGLLVGAALDDEASDFGLGVSNERVAKEIATVPVFKGPDGNFDHERFAAVLQNARMDPDQYVKDTRRGLIRGQVVNSVGAGVGVPKPLIEAVYRMQNEERTVSYVVVGAEAVEPVATPGESDLQAYYAENKERFGAPEYRKLGLLTLDPAALADPKAVTPEEVAAEYENRKANFTQPERRRIEQVSFDNAADAEAALAAVKGGKDFKAVAEERGLKPSDIDQGMKTKAEMLDPAVAAAAFSAAPQQPLAVTAGAIQPVLIRVTEVQPGSVTPLASVEGRLREDIAKRSARERIEDVYDQVEDERAAGSTLAETAEKLSLPYRVIENVSKDLKTPEGETLSDIPNGSAVVTEAFDSDVGVENSAVRAADAWVFFDVLEITPARDRTLDEVREEAVSGWKAEELKKRIAERAETLFQRLKGGATLASIAAEIGQEAQTIEHVKRGEPPAGLTANAAAQAFAGPEGHVANAEGSGDSRILLHVDNVIVPAFFEEAAGVDAIKKRLSDSLQQELVATYSAQLLAGRDTSINDAVYRQVSGQPQAQ